MRSLPEKRQNKFLFTFGSDSHQVPAHGFAEAFGFIPGALVAEDFVVMSLEGDAGTRLGLRLSLLRGILQRGLGAREPAKHNIALQCDQQDQDRDCEQPNTPEAWPSNFIWI